MHQFTTVFLNDFKEQTDAFVSSVAKVSATSFPY